MREPIMSIHGGQGSDSTPSRLSSPPLTQQRNTTYPYSGPNEDNRPSTTPSLWDLRPPSGPIPPISSRITPLLPELPSLSQPRLQSQIQSQYTPVPPKFHPDPNRPPLSAHRFVPSARPESPHHPQPPQPPSVDALSSQIIILEEKLFRMTELVNSDRIEHVRYNMDFTSYLLRMVGWAAGDKPTPEMRSLQDTLLRQNADMKQRYEAFIASNALATMASGISNTRERGFERESDERRGQFMNEPPIPSSTRSIHATLPTPRLAPSTSAPGSMTPLVSPLTRDFGEAHDSSRPPTGMTVTTSGEVYPFPPPPLPTHQQLKQHVNLPLPINLSRSSNPNISYFPNPSSSIIRHHNPSIGSTTSSSTNEDLRRAPRDLGHSETDEPEDAIHSIDNTSSVAASVSEAKGNAAARGLDLSGSQELKPRGGIRNLLN
ncbi:uncharacterized protein IL334_007303 [Kwoniella shivajii]|uniref:Uncharacterized protein n=1 Tax=Kwoniella shivajii TaxID=564305 RepID=A0ABZ1D8T1_9TREE|nr:hypothetical protein IL334_007303 [Kwoniella shivajii]